MDEPCRLGVVALGDSITNGHGGMQSGLGSQSWAQWLAQALGLPFTKLAEDGATARDVVEWQVPRLGERRFDLGCVYVGVNDARSTGWDAAAYERDLDAILAGLGARAERLLVCTLPLDLGRPTAAPKPAEANAVVRRVAGAHEATVAALDDFGGWFRVLPDAVHPTAVGQLEIADRAARALGAPMLPSALAEADRTVAGLARYLPAHARAVARDAWRRVRERAVAP